MRLRSFALLAAMCIAAFALPVAGASAASNVTLNVKVGAYLFDERTGEGPPGESMRFFPADMSVHKGDTLVFSGDFHTATFMPTSATDPDAWIAENATTPDDPWSFLKSNPDNQAFPLKLMGDNPIFPPNACGAADDPCSYGGNDVLDSGLLFDYMDFSQTPPTNPGFSVTVDANPGDTFWIYCRVHPKMRMRVAVVNQNEAATTQAQIDEYTQTTVTEDRRAATELDESLSATHESHMVDGKKVWTAYAGYDSDDFSLFSMYPRKLNVRRGQSVEWRFSTLNFEVHTVTLSGKKAFNLANKSQPILCDPNGDSESGGETETGFPPQCPEGAVHEAALGAKMLNPSGNGVVKGKKDLENSGVRGAGTPTKDPYKLKMAFAKGSSLKYICLIHPDMTGVVTVK
jgi:plastocyanin